MRSQAASGMALGAAVRKDKDTKENGKAWQWIEVRMMVNISLDTAAVPAPRNAKIWGMYPEKRSPRLAVQI